LDASGIVTLEPTALPTRSIGQIGGFFADKATSAFAFALVSRFGSGTDDMVWGGRGSVCKFLSVLEPSQIITPFGAKHRVLFEEKFITNWNLKSRVIIVAVM
jgi:hypothetical protein